MLTAHKVYLTLCVLAFFSSFASPAKGDEIISGVAVVEDCGELFVSGRKITLWGIDTLAEDQQCWQNDAAWSCGAQAVTALRHYVDGLQVECHVQSSIEGVGPEALCYRNKKEIQQDIGDHLVRQGLAMKSPDNMLGVYAEAEEEARTHKRGVWTSRFQTAHDWREGIQCYVGEPCLREEPIVDETTVFLPDEEDEEEESFLDSFEEDEETSLEQLDEEYGG